MKHIVQFSGGKDSTAMLLISLLMELFLSFKPLNF